MTFETDAQRDQCQADLGAVGVARALHFVKIPKSYWADLDSNCQTVMLHGQELPHEAYAIHHL